ncbi:MAG: hypothetical protein QOI73_35 [Solirubrobacteraceae bacterium]|nr:hypothetical protein [Solirubrobacteraceae bacterium]
MMTRCVLRSMPRTRRPRRYVAPKLLWLLQPLMRQSPSRDAWILRVVGERYGPVLRRREDGHV